MGFFVEPGETAIIAGGVQYLRIEGSMYVGIGILFLWYGYFRAIRKPQVSLILTVISLGTRVALSYALAPPDGTGGRRHLAVHSHRLGAGRSGRPGVLSPFTA